MATMTAPTTPYNAQQVKVASGLDVVAGIWLLLSPFVIEHTGAMMWSNIICGILVAVMAGMRAGGAYNAAWMSWTNAVIGVYVLLSPWILGAMYDGEFWNAVITGLAIIILAGWSAMATTNTRNGRAPVTEVRNPPPSQPGL